MILVLLTTTFVFIIAFIATSLVDIDGVHEPISSCDKGIRGSLITTHNPNVFNPLAKGAQGFSCRVIGTKFGGS